MIQEVQELLAASLANSATFQTFVGAGDATAALAKVYHDVMPAPAGDRYTEAELEQLRPSALIYTDMYEDDYNATDDCWNASGRLVCKLRRTTPAEGTDSEIDISFREVAGALKEDLKAMSHTAGRLSCRNIVVIGPFRTQPNETKAAGDYQEIEIIVGWGVK